MPTVLHVSPHPDDELLGAPATLMALRDAGWRVVNLAWGLGRPPQRRRREGELREACRRAGFELRLGGEDPEADLGTLLAELGPELVVSPCQTDRHPAHERVAAAVGTVLAGRREPPSWWQWALWGALPAPSLGCGFGRERLAEIEAALSAHAGELERNEYRRLLRARAEATACLAPELLFGFGGSAAGAPELAELLEERRYADGGWRLGTPRWLDPAAPLDP